MRESSAEQILQTLTTIDKAETVYFELQLLLTLQLPEPFVILLVA